MSRRAVSSCALQEFVHCVYEFVILLIRLSDRPRKTISYILQRTNSRRAHELPAHRVIWSYSINKQQCDVRFILQQIRPCQAFMVVGEFVPLSDTYNSVTYINYHHLTFRFMRLFLEEHLCVHCAESNQLKFCTVTFVSINISLFAQQTNPQISSAHE